MEPPLKRQRLETGVSSAPTTEHVIVSTVSQHWRDTQAIRAKLKGRFESIFDKYERDFTGIGDEIDLMTGEVVVNNGHLAHMISERDAHGGAIDSGEDESVDSDADESVDSDADADELASFETRKVATPVRSPSLCTPAVRIPVLEQLPQDPRWAAPEIPGLQQPVNLAQLELHDDLLDDRSDDFQGPERSLWHIDAEDVKVSDGRMRQTWTDDELAFLHRLKNSGEAITVPQIHRKYLPHRPIPSIRLRWYDLAGDVASQKLTWPGLDSQSISNESPTALNRDDFDEVVDSTQEHSSASVEALLEDQLISEDDYPSLHPNSEHEHEPSVREESCDQEEQEDFTLHTTRNSSEISVRASCTVPPQDWVNEIHFLDSQAWHRDTDIGIALPPSPKVYVPIIPDRLRRLAPLKFPEASNDELSGVEPLDELRSRPLIGASLKNSLDDSGDNSNVESHLSVAGADADSVEQHAVRCDDNRSEEPNADFAQSSFDELQLVDANSPDAKSIENHTTKNGPYAGVVPAETQSTVPETAFLLQTTTLFGSDSNRRKSPSVEQYDTEAGKRSLALEIPKKDHSEDIVETSTARPQSPTDGDTRDLEGVAAVQPSTEDDSSRMAVKAPTDFSFTSLDHHDRVNVTPHRVGVSTPRVRARTQFRKRHGFISPSLAALEGDHDENEDGESPLSPATMLRSAESQRMLKNWSGSLQPLSGKRQICGRGGFKCKRSICLRCIV